MIARIDGAWREITSGRVRIAGAWKQITAARCYVGGAWKDIPGFTPPFSVTLSPLDVSGLRAGAGVVTTSSVTATPAGGTSPYTYAWTRISGTSSTALSPTISTTSFRMTLGANQSVTETWRCTVTDATGQTATADVDAEFTTI